jgi:small subunit ribosomal protein S20
MAQQREAARALDKAVAKGIVHKRTAARRKSRLAKGATSVASSEQ